MQKQWFLRCARQKATTAKDVSRLPPARRRQPCSSSFSSLPTRGSNSSAGSVAEIHCQNYSSDSEEVLQNFESFYHLRQPVILRNYAQDCRAVRTWTELDYLKDRVGANVLCDVEVGAYNQGERLSLPFEAYIQYLRLWQEQYESSDQEPPADQILYLAQNDMRVFGPELMNDIALPQDLCGRFGQGLLYSSMLWLGPKGCVSPLHYDPLDNILVQLVGRKRVRLLSPEEVDPESLYVGEEHGQQHNTSAVNVEHPDGTKHPLYLQGAITAVQSLELGPGDALFIPAKWWHHVRSLDLSASVNTWWR